MDAAFLEALKETIRREGKVQAVKAVRERLGVGIGEATALRDRARGTDAIGAAEVSLRLCQGPGRHG